MLPRSRKRRYIYPKNHGTDVALDDLCPIFLHVQGFSSPLRKDSVLSPGVFGLTTNVMMHVMRRHKSSDTALPVFFHLAVSTEQHDTNL